MSEPVSPLGGDSSAAHMHQGNLSLSGSLNLRKFSQRKSVLPLCMSTAQHEARRISSFASPSSRRRQTRLSQAHGSSANPAQTTVPSSNGWGQLLSYAETHAEVGRALQMCSVYPTMRVAGTAFENSLHVAGRHTALYPTNGSFRAHPPTKAVTTGGDGNGSTVMTPQEESMQSPMMSISVAPDFVQGAREGMEDSRSILEGGAAGILAAALTGGRRSFSSAADVAARTLALTSGATMVQLACALKRAAMWEVILAVALFHRAMEDRFRHQRLRRTLERHLLPTVLHRKKKTGCVVAKGALEKVSRRDSSGSGEPPRGPARVDASAAPQGVYLRDHDDFFESLHNAAILESLAETMTRHRFVPGDVIARAGEPSQAAMYFLISGKCEVSTDRIRAEEDVAENANTVDPEDGGFRTSLERQTDNVASRPTKEVLLPGCTFGGVFCGSSVFAGTYKALSQCIVWILKADDFERIFRPFADRTMLDKYKEVLRAHNLWWLKQRYIPSKCYSSIPIYRKLTRRISVYLDDFSPMVKVRGETLFAQGDGAGDVYCLLEGTVLRRTKSLDGTHGDDNLAQRLGTNSFAALNVAGRYILLGEEPHLVSGMQPYTCVVSSRVALFFSVSGERFVNALLDDPSLYAQLRERLIQQRQSSMRLHPECLAHVPLLQRFPAEKRVELAQVAQPRVITASVTLCDPAQHLSDLFIIISGAVRDPRQYSHKPTKPLEVPAPCDSENGESSTGDGGGQRSLNATLTSAGGYRNGMADRRQHGGQAAATTHSSERGVTRSQAADVLVRQGSGSAPGTAQKTKGVLCSLSTAAADSQLKEDGEEALWNFSFRDRPFPTAIPTALSSLQTTVELRTAGQPTSSSAPATGAPLLQNLLESAPFVYPDESEEINPPLPPQPARRFTCTLGGNWEALLSDKWSNGWESMTTVELWTIPTRLLRLAYNSCSKPVQQSILNGLRHAQKDDLQLPTVPHTKLPPMSVYATHSEVAVPTSGKKGKETGSSSARGFSRRNPGRHEVPQCRLSVSRHGMRAVAGGEDGEALGEGPSSVTINGSGFGHPSGASKMKTAPHAHPPEPTKHPGAPQRGPPSQPVAQKAVPNSRTRGLDEMPEPRPVAKGNFNIHRPPPNRGGHSRSPHHLCEKTSARGVNEAAAAQPPVDVALKALYDGKPDAVDPLMLRIVRDPAEGEASRGNGARLSLSAPGLPPVRRNLVSKVRTERVAAAAWPVLTPAQDRWFQAVPSYEPLPGTVRAAQTLASPPVFELNTSVLAAAGISSTRQHGKTLEGHISFYAASISPHRSPTRALLSGTGIADASVMMMTTPVASTACVPSQQDQGASRSGLPKRHAYAM